MQTSEDLKRTFCRIREIGYETVQFSGASTKEAELIGALSREYALPVACTHVQWNRLIEETDALIEEHRAIGCPVIGLGAMPKELRGGLEGAEAFLQQLQAPVANILDAGLRFAYHNHHFEFEEVAPDKLLYELLLERGNDWLFIPDVYWMEYAGQSAAEWLRRLGKKRIAAVHFKDLAADENRSICACGKGTLDFAALSEACRGMGIEDILVEQDNAVESTDPFAEMAFSFAHLKPMM